MTDKKGINTRVVGAGRSQDQVGQRGQGGTRHLVNPPVSRASTVLFDTYAALRDGVRHMYEGLFYGRFGTPTHWALEDAMTELEGGAGARLFPSGQAAVTVSLLSVLKAGDHLLMVDSVYEPSRKFTKRLLERFGVETTFYEPLIGAGIADLMQDNTTCVFVESPGSLTMEVQDLPAIAEVAHGHGAAVIADNTWATPLYFRALDKGADIAVYAATKYIGGHSDLMLGVAVANEQYYKDLRMTAQTMGQLTGPDDAWLSLRGLRTLPTRLARHQESAMIVANWLNEHPMVARVLHPALPGAAGHEIFKRDFTGASGLFSIVLKDGELKNIGAMVDHMEHFGMGFSWGGFESLILPTDPGPVRSSCPWQANGPLLRLSIGLEDVDDLIADLDAGLQRFAATI